jgi:hypothetical protein
VKSEPLVLERWRPVWLWHWSARRDAHDPHRCYWSAIVITVYEPDPRWWDADFKRRVE